MNALEFYNTFCHGLDRCLRQELSIVHGRHYRIAGHNSVRVISVKLQHINPHYYSKVVGLKNEIGMFGGLSDEQPIRFSFAKRSIILEIPKPAELFKTVTLDNLEKNHLIRRGLSATLGLDLHDAPARIDFSQEHMAHVFVSGETGSGKTNTQRLMAWNLSRNLHPDDGQLLIFDVAKKGFKWADFGNILQLAHPIITELDEADKVLSWLNREIDIRASERRNTPKVFVLIDELKSLLDDSNVAEGYLSRIASVGREFGLHLILSTQYPAIKMLGSSELKRNVSTRLCGRVDDAQAAINALGVKNSGAESLQGYGDFLLKTLRGLERIAVVEIKPSHVKRLPKIETVPMLDLPDLDVVNNGATSTRQPDALEAEHVALALFEPAGITKLAQTLSIGSAKAKRINEFAQSIRKWADENDHRCLPE